MIQQIVALIILSGFCSTVIAQNCIKMITATTNISDYRINNDGTVTDMRLQLTWAACALGQQWKNNNCVGDAEPVDWQQANKKVIEYQAETSKQWRLPTIHELSSITELSCESPAINLQLFPNTPSLHFWTGVEFVNNTSKAWQVFFGTGENHTAKKTTKAAARLVRSLENKN